MLYKSALKEIPPIPMDKVILRKFQYKGVSKIVDTKKCGKVLVVDIHKRKPKEMLYRFFSDGTGFQIYDVKNDSWTQSKVQSLLSGRTGYTYYGWVGQDRQIAATPETIAMMKKFLGEDKGRNREGITGIMDDFIGNIIAERRLKTYHNKRMRIDEKMAMYPALPADFKSYLKEDVFPQYVFMSKLEKGKKPGVCTSCGKKLKLEKGTKHRSIITCPKCGREVVAFEKRYIDSIAENATVCITDRVDNQLILRWINIVGYWYISAKTGKCEFSFKTDEFFRTMYLREKGQLKIRHFEFKYVYPWGAEWREKDFSKDDLSYVYSHNLEAVFGKRYYNVDLQQELSENIQPLHFVKMLDNLKNLPPTEYLVKMGMYRLASQLDPDNMKAGRDFGTILGVNPQYKKLYCDKNISLDEHNLIQASNAWVTEEDFMKMRRLNLNSSQTSTACDMLATMSYKRFVNYFTKQRRIYPRQNFDQLLRWYNDYIDMSEQMEIDLSHKSVRFPKDIKEAHDRLLKEYKVVENEILDEQLRKATERLYAGLTEYKNDGYAIVFPRTKTEFIVEGQSLNHCVGTNESYFNNHMKGTKMIFFIRKEEEISTPFVTMEIDMQRLIIQQIYGYGDKRPAQAVINFANKFLRLLKNENVAVGRAS